MLSCYKEEFTWRLDSVKTTFLMWMLVQNPGIKHKETQTAPTCRKRRLQAQQPQRSPITAGRRKGQAQQPQAQKQKSAYLQLGMKITRFPSGKNLNVTRHLQGRGREETKEKPVTMEMKSPLQLGKPNVP